MTSFHVIDICLSADYRSGPGKLKPLKKPSKKLQQFLDRYDGKQITSGELPRGLYIEDLCAGISLAKGVDRVFLTHVSMSPGGTWRKGDKS